MVKSASSGAWLQIIIAIPPLALLASLPLLSYSSNLTQQPEGHLKKDKSDPITPLLNTFPWLPISLRTEAQVLPTAYETM